MIELGVFTVFSFIGSNMHSSLLSVSVNVKIPNSVGILEIPKENTRVPVLSGNPDTLLVFFAPNTRIFSTSGLQPV